MLSGDCSVTASMKSQRRTRSGSEIYGKAEGVQGMLNESLSQKWRVNNG